MQDKIIEQGFKEILKTQSDCARQHAQATKDLLDSIDLMRKEFTNMFDQINIKWEK